MNNVPLLSTRNYSKIFKVYKSKILLDDDYGNIYGVLSWEFILEIRNTTYKVLLKFWKSGQPG